MTCKMVRLASNTNYNKVMALLGILFFLVPLSGCIGTTIQSPRAVSAIPVKVLATSETNLNLEASKALEVSLVSGSNLAKLAELLDRAATSKSSFVHEGSAAEAALIAAKFDKFPKVKPSASAPFIGSGNGSAVFGLDIEQTVWDGGRVRSKLANSKLSVEEARLNLWMERNQAVFDGLVIFIKIARVNAKIVKLSEQKSHLELISLHLRTRLSGGFSDRGELLRVTTALQEVGRRLLSSKATRRQLKADLSRLLPANTMISSKSRFSLIERECNRSWPLSTSPVDSLARISLLRAEASQLSIRARRSPKILITAGTEYSQAGWSAPAVGFRLDATDMLGFGRKNNLAAFDAAVRSAKALYEIQRQETNAQLTRLNYEFEGLNVDIFELRKLVKHNTEIIGLYLEQLNSGTISLTDGIGLYSEAAETQIALLDAESDLVLNCLRSSQIRGLLAVRGET